MATGPVFPRVHVLVVCDEIEEIEEGVFTLTGVRTEIRAGHFPYTHRQLCVYLQVTGHEGESLCRICVNDSADDATIFSTDEQVVVFQGPLRVLGVTFWVADCVFPTAGVYYVQVYFGGKLCGERLLILSQTEARGNGQEET